MILERRKIRTQKNGTDTSSETQSVATDSLAFNLAAAGNFLIGYHEKFASRYIYLKVPNVNASSILLKYWNGTNFVGSTNLIDQTSGFTRSGFISWENESDWEISAQGGIPDELYWVQVTVTSDLSALTELQAVLNLFSDDDLLRAYYPDFVSDTRFLPPGRTDFIEQHEAAKNLVVQRLKQKRVISEESQILDINTVAVSAVHGCAAIILSPIAQSEQQLGLLTRAKNDFEKELSLVNLGVDITKDGTVSQSERSSLTTGDLIRL